MYHCFEFFFISRMSSLSISFFWSSVTIQFSSSFLPVSPVTIPFFLISQAPCPFKNLQMPTFPTTIVTILYVSSFFFFLSFYNFSALFQTFLLSNCSLISRVITSALLNFPLSRNSSFPQTNDFMIIQYTLTDPAWQTISVQTIAS